MLATYFLEYTSDRKLEVVPVVTRTTKNRIYVKLGNREKVFSLQGIGSNPNMGKLIPINEDNIKRHRECAKRNLSLSSFYSHLLD